MKKIRLKHYKGFKGRGSHSRASDLRADSLDSGSLFFKYNFIGVRLVRGKK